MRAHTNNQYPESSGITLEDFLLMLDKVKKVGDKWIARCPAHDDGRPSLGIKCAGDRILVNCWAGCSYHEITASMGLRPRDLFYDSLTDDRRREYRLNHIDRRIQQADTVIYFGNQAMTNGTITNSQRQEYRDAIVNKHSLIDEKATL